MLTFAHKMFVPLPATTAQITTVQVAAMAIIVAGLTIYMIATRNRIRRSTSQPRATSRERLANAQRRTRLARDIEDVMGDLDELSRQVNGKLDVRFAKLEAVIRDADARINQLTRLTRAARGAPTLDVTVADEAVEPPGSSDTTTSSAVPDLERPLHAEVYDLADQGLTPVDIATRTSRTTGEVELILALRRAKAQAQVTAARPSSSASRP